MPRSGVGAIQAATGECRGGCTDAGMVRKGHEPAARAVVGVDAARFDVVDPAVQREAPFLEREPHGRMRLQVGQLRDDVLAHHRVDPFALAAMRARLVHDPCRIGIAQPVANGRHVVHALAGRNRGHRTAIGMPADHDVRHAQRGDRIFDRRRHAARLRAVRRHDVARVADHEQVARLALRDELRHEPAIRARDEQRPRILAACEIAKQRGARRIGVALELQEAFDDVLHRVFSGAGGIDEGQVTPDFR